MQGQQSGQPCEQVRAAHGPYGAGARSRRIRTRRDKFSTCRRPDVTRGDPRCQLQRSPAPGRGSRPRSWMPCSVAIPAAGMQPSALRIFVRHIPASERRCLGGQGAGCRRAEIFIDSGAEQDCARLLRTYRTTHTGVRAWNPPVASRQGPCRMRRHCRARPSRGDGRLQWVMPSRRTTLRKVRRMIFRSKARDWRRR